MNKLNQKETDALASLEKWTFWCMILTYVATVGIILAYCITYFINNP